MATWTIEFRGHWLPGWAVVSADNVDIACELVRAKLSEHGLTVDVKPEMLVPMVTSTGFVRVLSDGSY